jgi:hypothetical protein
MEQTILSALQKYPAAGNMTTAIWIIISALLVVLMWKHHYVRMLQHN